MNKHPTCGFSNCNNRVAIRPSGKPMPLCPQCEQKVKEREKKQDPPTEQEVEDDGEITLYESSVEYLK